MLHIAITTVYKILQRTFLIYKKILLNAELKYKITQKILTKKQTP